MNRDAFYLPSLNGRNTYYQYQATRKRTGTMACTAGKRTGRSSMYTQRIFIDRR